LLREYIVLLIAEIFNEKNGIIICFNRNFIEIFELTDTHDHYYKCHTSLRVSPIDLKKVEIFKLFGAALGKALLEKIPILPHVDYLYLNNILRR